MLTKAASNALAPSAATFNVLCYINRHRPHGHKANWTGEHYASRCEDCRKPIRRVSQGKWVSDDRIIPYLSRAPIASRTTA